MEQRDFTIRRERAEDYAATEDMIRESFWNVYRPGCMEHYLMRCLRESPDFVWELDLVMEKDGKLIGQVAFMRGEICCDDGRRLPVLTLGPIGIAPDYKRQGYGKALLDYALEQAAELGYGAVCLEGNILFYGKSGFVRGSAFSLRYHGMPEGKEATFFLCRELKSGYLEGISGEYAPPAAYDIDESRVEDFDAQFPPREKLRLPGQLF